MRVEGKLDDETVPRQYIMKGNGKAIGGRDSLNPDL
jgi:hypothetical protein